MSLIKEYITYTDYNGFLKKRKIYKIIDKSLKNKNKLYIETLNNINDSIVLNDNYNISYKSFKDVIEKIKQEKKYNHYFYLDLKNPYESVDYKIAFSLLKKKFINLNTFFDIYNFYNWFIYSYIQKTFKHKNKSLYIGLESSRILFDILIKHILNNTKVSSKVFFYYDSFVICNDDINILNDDITLLRKNLSEYNLYINKKKSKLIKFFKTKTFFDDDDYYTNIKNDLTLFNLGINPKKKEPRKTLILDIKNDKYFVLIYNKNKLIKKIKILMFCFIGFINFFFYIFYFLISRFNN